MPTKFSSSIINLKEKTRLSDLEPGDVFIFEYEVKQIVNGGDRLENRCRLITNNNRYTYLKDGVSIHIDDQRDYPVVEVLVEISLSITA